MNSKFVVVHAIPTEMGSVHSRLRFYCQTAPENYRPQHVLRAVIAASAQLGVGSDELWVQTVGG